MFCRYGNKLKGITLQDIAKKPSEQRDVPKAPETVQKPPLRVNY